MIEARCHRQHIPISFRQAYLSDRAIIREYVVITISQTASSADIFTQESSKVAMNYDEKSGGTMLKIASYAATVGRMLPRAS